jgi:methionine-R-sulfoxide reductase
MKYNPLSDQELAIIQDKGTETPFTGKYDNFFQAGIYVCKRCNTPLYQSSSKFDAHCGWPSFEQEIDGAVIHQPDPDGIRTEIICATCQAHLGHLFIGEKFTPKNTRHCVNSTSLKFIPA